MYSAIKRAGVPLYRLARRGDEVAPPETRSVEIKRLDLICEAPDTIRFVATCSPGTYARALARDIGRRARDSRASRGTPPHPQRCVLDCRRDAARRRPRSSRFRRATRPTRLALRDALVGMPEVVVDATAEKRLRNGDSRALDSQVPSAGPLFKVISHSGNLIAVARVTSRVTAIVERIFNLDAEELSPDPFPRGKGDNRGDRIRRSPRNMSPPIESERLSQSMSRLNRVRGHPCPRKRETHGGFRYDEVPFSTAPVTLHPIPCLYSSSRLC